MKFLGTFSLALAFIFPLAPDTEAFADSAAMILPVDEARLEVINPDGSTSSFSIEVADENHEQSAGLMFRLSLADDHGMLFVFDRTKRLSFWMKNTALPLDLIFIGEDGKVIDVLPGKPFSLSPISPAEPGRFVFEVKSGIANKNGIVAGSLMRHPTIDAISGIN